MNSDEIELALKPLTDTERVVIIGIAAYDLILSLDGGEELTFKIPFDTTEDTLLASLLEAYPELDAVLA
jgi:hypothetical protein